MSHLGVLLVLVQAHTSTPRNSNSDITHMTRRTITNNLDILPLRINNPGVSFLGEAGEETVVGVVLVALTSQGLPGVLSSTNDNQFLLNPPVQLSVIQGDISQCQGSKTMDYQETVNCCVVAPAVAKERRKTLSVKRKNKICERCFVCKSLSLCSSCQKCPSCCQRSTYGRPSAKFWQVWLSLGSNPRVVSILKEGYSLPFKVRPPLSRSPVIVMRIRSKAKT